ncbi:ankyrin repeat domain-containing protein [Candidatus Dependentiae bacterium]|nr:ankyrin repeat domain-containing protein [Candidatus Dependentiae bacterium]
MHYFLFVSLLVSGFSSLAMNPSDQLLAACETGNIQQAVNVLIAGADVNSQNRYGVSPLIAAAYNNNSDLVKLLLNKGANLNLKTHLNYIKMPGYSALHAALSSLLLADDNASARLLIAAGIDPFIESGRVVAKLTSGSYLNSLKGQEALDLARENQPIVVVKLIAEYRDLVSEARLNPSLRALERAVELGMYSLVGPLLKVVSVSYEQEKKYAQITKQNYLKAKQSNDLAGMFIYQKIGMILRECLDPMGPEYRISTTSIVGAYGLPVDVVNSIRQNL